MLAGHLGKCLFSSEPSQQMLIVLLAYISIASAVACFCLLLGDIGHVRLHRF
jgi:hypothetical protein